MMPSIVPKPHENLTTCEKLHHAPEWRDHDDDLWRNTVDAFFGDPVDAATGLLVVTKTDMVLPGRLPLTLTRTYQTNGAVNGLPRPRGQGGVQS